MIWFRGCPRCRGDLYLDKDIYGWYRKCLQCGYLQDLIVPFVSHLPIATAIPQPVMYLREERAGKVHSELEKVVEIAA